MNPSTSLLSIPTNSTTAKNSALIASLNAKKMENNAVDLSTSSGQKVMDDSLNPDSQLTSNNLLPAVGILNNGIFEKVMYA